MNILMLSRFFYPHIGGVEKHIEEIARRLIKKGYKVTIITEKIANTKEFEVIKKIRIFRLPYPKIRFIGLFWIWIWLLKNRSLINQSSLVHCHDVFIWYLPIRFLTPKKPVYITFHGYEGPEIPTHKAVFHHKLAERLSWGNICIGDFHKKWYGVKPTFISYGAVNLGQKQKNDSSKQKSAVFIGRLDKDTGILTYIKALATLYKQNYKQNISFSLDIFGDGPQKAKAEKLIQKCRLPCRFHGFVKEANKKLFKFKFAFVSRYLAILEAMAAKRLVFAVYDNEIKKDYLQMAPFAQWIVIESDPKKLAEKIKYYLNHPKAEKKLVNQAYNWAKKQTWEKVTAIYLKLWNLK